MIPGPGPGRTIRRAVAVALAASGVALVVGGVQACEIFLRPMADVLFSRSISCPVTRPPELWWTAVIMHVCALVLWLPPDRASRLWRRPFFRLTVRRRCGLLAGTVLMAGGVSLVLAAMVGLVLGSTTLDLLAGWLGFGGRLSGGPPTVIVAGTGLAAVWWGVAELHNAGRPSREKLIFLLALAGGIGATTTVLGDVIGIGWPGFGLRQLGVAIVFVLVAAGAVALARTPSIRWLPVGPSQRLLAGASTIVLGTWTALTTRLPTVCYGFSCTWEPLVSVRVAVPLAALGLYLVVAQYRRHQNLRTAYRDETQFAPISTI